MKKGVTEEDKGQSWWENDQTVVSLILGLPIIGLISIGILSLIGINTSEFPLMFSREFFMTDLFLKLLTLPIGVILIRVIMRRVNID
jgi:hypothetical protein